MSSRRLFLPAAMAVAACLTAPPGATAAERTLKPRFDTYVNAAKPSRSYAHAHFLKVGNHPRRWAFLRFRLRRAPGKLVRTTLRLRVAAGAGAQLIVRGSGRRRHRHMTYWTAPKLGRQLGSALITQRGWVEIDLPPRLTRHRHAFRLALATSTSKRIKVGSRNSRNSPELVLETAATDGTPAAEMTFLGNGAVQLGVNLSEGGTIQYLASSSDGRNVINDYDLGRQVQQSYYAGPRPFGNPAPPWDDFPWNPVGTGDHYGHRSEVLDWSNDGATLYVKSRPLQWALDNVPCECTFEQWVTLDGTAVWVRNRLTNERSDATQYPAFEQELPALYAIGKLRNLVSYTGAQPFQGRPTSVINLPPERFTFQATEHWAALVDEQGWGLGLVQPDITRFLTHFVGPVDQGRPNDFSANYLAPDIPEILDANISYEYAYGLVLGSVDQIRSYATAHVPTGPPSYVFQHSRAHWWYRNAVDAGWPIQGALHLSLDQHHPQMIGPVGLWSAGGAPKLYISAAYHGLSSPTAHMYWKVAGDSTWKGGVRFDPATDGDFHTYEIDLSHAAGYSGAITQLRFDPSDGGDTGASVDVASISTTPLG